MITLTGKKVSEGIAIGKLTFYKRDIKVMSNVKLINNAIYDKVIFRKDKIIIHNKNDSIGMENLKTENNY